MAATKEDVDRWIEIGNKIGATHVISVWDRFGCEDYPVYVLQTESVKEKKKKYDGVNMQSINEIIKLT